MTRLLTLCLILIPAVSLAQNERQAPLKLAVTGSVPFSFAGDEPSGLSVDVWNAVASDLGLDAELVQVDKPISEVLRGIRTGGHSEFDGLIAPTSITSERAELVWFSQPYFGSGLSILSTYEPPSFWDHAGPLVWWVLVALFVFFGIGGGNPHLREDRQRRAEDPRHPVDLPGALP